MALFPLERRLSTDRIMLEQLTRCSAAKMETIEEGSAKREKNDEDQVSGEKEDDMI